MLGSLLGAKLGATIAGVAVGLGGTAVAAYTGALPTGAQNIAHTTIGAPAATPSPTPKPTETEDGVGPDAKGPAAFGLCNAWTHHQANGAKPTNSVAFRNLATAAGGESKIAAYCAKIPHPGNRNHTTGKPTAKPTGKDTNKSTGKPTNKPTGKATDKPSEKTTPSTQPTTSITTQPTASITTQPTASITTQPTATSTTTQR